MTGGDEVPTAAGIAKVHMPAKNAVAAVQLDTRIFDMDMEDALSKLIDEFNRVDELVNEVRWIKIKTKRRVIIYCFQSPLRGDQVICNFSRVNLQSKFDIVAFENIQN